MCGQRCYALEDGPHEDARSKLIGRQLEYHVEKDGDDTTLFVRLICARCILSVKMLFDDMEKSGNLHKLNLFAQQPGLATVNKLVGPDGNPLH